MIVRRPNAATLPRTDQPGNLAVCATLAPLDRRGFLFFAFQATPGFPSTSRVAERPPARPAGEGIGRRWGLVGLLIAAGRRLPPHQVDGRAGVVWSVGVAISSSGAGAVGGTSGQRRDGAQAVAADIGLAGSAAAGRTKAR